MMKLKRNMIKCNKCGDIIESKSVHNFVTCKCGACSVDGGLCYAKRSFLNTPYDFTDLSEWEEYTLTVFEAYKALGYNYITRDDKNLVGYTRTCVWVCKPELFLYDDYMEKDGKEIEGSYYIFQLNGNDKELRFMDIDDSNEIKPIKEKECMKLPNVKMDRGTVEEALKTLGFKYVAREEQCKDGYSRLVAFTFKPIRIDGEFIEEDWYDPGYWCQNNPDNYFGIGNIDIYNNVFPDVTWESEPYEIK